MKHGAPTAVMVEDRAVTAAATVAALRLAHGTTPSGEVDWSAVIAAAITQRCAPLAWLRSSETIRAMAPAAVAAQWRRHMLCAAEQSSVQARELVSLVRRLDEIGIGAAVIKGLPLGVLLYGDIAARPSTDFDLFIRREDRAAAHHALIESGWLHMRGVAPGEALYQQSNAVVCPWLELHSSLLDENLLAHLSLPAPDTTRVVLGEDAVHAQCGVLLPVFLAAHLAKHTNPPLLWWVDFATAYGLLDTSAREVLAGQARALRLERYVDWAIRGARMLSYAVTKPSDEAARWLARLEAHGRGHNGARVMMLARSRRDRLAVIASWIWPREARWSADLFARQAWYRLSRLPASIQRVRSSLDRAPRSA